MCQVNVSTDDHNDTFILMELRMSRKLLFVITLIFSLLQYGCNKKDSSQREEEDMEWVYEGGAVLTMCVPPEKSVCNLVQEERNSTWGIFPSFESCHFKEVLWKELGVKGDPQCVPCRKITFSYLGGMKFFDCEWQN